MQCRRYSKCAHDQECSEAMGIGQILQKYAFLYPHKKGEKKTNTALTQYQEQPEQLLAPVLEISSNYILR